MRGSVRQLIMGDCAVGTFRKWRLVPSFISLMIATFLVEGCRMENESWIRNMIAEAESAYIQADQAGLGQEGRDVAVTAAVKKYIYPGMSKKEILGILLEMMDYGFAIREYRQEGIRLWSAEELKRSSGENGREKVNRASSDPDEFICIYRYRRGLVEHFISIRFRLKNGVVLEEGFKARLSASFI